MVVSSAGMSVGSSATETSFFFGGVADDETDLFVFDVTGSDFQADRDSFLFPVVVFPAGVVEEATVVFDADPNLLQICDNSLTVGISILYLKLLSNNGHNNNLHGGHSRRKDQTSVIPMNHNHNPNSPSGQPPTSLPGNSTLSLIILKGNIKHLPKILPQIMRRGTLNRPTTLRNVGLHRSRPKPPRKLLLFRFVALNDGNTQ